jgi:hypothetical protein
MEYRSRSVRLGDDVWAAIQAHEKSANQILREALGLNGTKYTPKIEAKIKKNVTPRGPLLKPKERK